MNASARHRAAALVAIVAMSLVLCAPSIAAAAPKSTLLDAKKAEHAAALKQLEQQRADLQLEIEQYGRLGRQIERAQSDVSQISTQIAEMDFKLAEREDALVRRTIQLYRGDRIGLLGVLLDAESISDLMDRLNYLMTISRHDTQVLTDVRLARSESAWLREGMTDQIRQLQDLQNQAATQRSRIESDLAAQQKRAEELGSDITAMLAAEQAQLTAVGGTPSGAFNPDFVISDASFETSGGMGVAEIQAFLDKQPGTLKTYRGTDHLGRSRSAAEMIAEASVAWQVSPKVILVTLQKEQSLLQRQYPTQRAYDWAMGCGKMDSRTLGGYAGFGTQIWQGARVLHKNAAPWTPGVTMRIDGSAVMPMNRSTYTLYKYTPHFHGQMSFWLLYWRYFGDPTLG